jgi:DNA-binding LacI/PurR family transcriptional regulator
MHDIAWLAEVSLGTVSHVINGKVGVRPQVRARVLKATDELGYQPNQLYRALRTNRINLIGRISFTDFTEPALTSIVQPSYQLGFTAAKLLLDRIEEDTSQPQHIVLKTELAIMDSVQSPAVAPLSSSEGDLRRTIRRDKSEII